MNVASSEAHVRSWPADDRTGEDGALTTPFAVALVGRGEVGAA